MKKLYMVCNAHIDPIWQWEWEEGAATAVSTFRCAADFCEEFDGFVFNHNEALLYRWIEEYEPALFARIQKLVKKGKWKIMGGWHLQPDDNMPAGEGFTRQILEGRRYFEEKFGVRPSTAIGFDAFGHTRGLVQILKKSGYDSFVFQRPHEVFMHLESELFVWVGYDGSEIYGKREMEGYGTLLGHAHEKIRRYAEAVPEDGFDLCLWGVGDHGGGASRDDLQKIAALKKELAEKGIEIVHESLDGFFAAVRDKKPDLPRHEADLNLWAPGCYTSQVRVKQTYRRFEALFFATEKMCVAAENAGMKYPAEELSQALYDLLTVQFHDVLPGSSVQPAEEMALRMMDHGIEILSRIRARAFFALSAGQRVAASDEIPILLFNPHPYPVEGDFACEMMLWDQDRDFVYDMPQVYQNGEKLPTQCEKENSSIPINWRKRPVFHATLQPLSINRFDCKYERLPEKPVATLPTENGHYIFKNDRLTAEISRETGWLDRLCVDGRELLAGPAVLDIVADNCDPWGMTVTSFPEHIGTFSLLTPEDGSEYSGINGVIESVRVIEGGPVRTVVEAVLGYGHSRAVVTYLLPVVGTEIGVNVRLQFAEVQKMVKWCIPTAVENARCIGQVAFGEESLPTNGRENVAQKYIVMENDDTALAVLNNGIYGSSCEEGKLMMTLIRSASYTAHPVDDRTILPQDRFSPHIDIGERLYNFALYGGETAAIHADVARRADVMAEAPMALSFFPSGAGEIPAVPLTLEGDTVQCVAYKRAENGRGHIVRLFNPSKEPHDAVICTEGKRFPVTLGTYEVATWRILKGKLIPCDLTEK